MVTMEVTNKTGKRKRGKCKVRNRSSRAPSSGEQMLPAVATESPERPEEKQDVPALHVAGLYGELVSVQNQVGIGQWWINSSDSQGQCPLHMVLLSGVSPNTPACLKYLLEHEADVNATTHSGQTPLHLAASKGLLNCVEILVKAGANVMMKDSMGHTPLDLARIWCHRKVARYLKNCMWQAEKEQEMEDRKLVQGLYRDLVNTVKQNTNKKTIVDAKMAEWANKKGLPLVKDFSPRVQRVSQYHAQCLLSDQTRCEPKQSKLRCKSQTDDPHKERSTLSKQPVASSTNPWTIFMGLQPEKPAAEPDLRDSITLWRDTSSRQLQYRSKWDKDPHPIPKLPLDVVERVLFPRAFSSRIATPQQFEPHNIDKVRHLGCPQGRRTSPWTEVAMHLAEVLEPGHYWESFIQT